MAKHCSIAAAILCLSAKLLCYPVTPHGSEDIPKLMNEATLVCKGEVTQAPPPVLVASPPSLHDLTATAIVRVDQCFKGSASAPVVSVAFDGVLPAAGGPSFVLHKGDYRLFFLKPLNDRFAVVDTWSGALPISRRVAPPVQDPDPMYRLERDLKAGLKDSDPELVHDNIQMLGNLRHLRSTAELKQMLSTQDLLVKAYLWQALLRLGDYSVLSELGAFFDSQPELPREFRLPGDQLLYMQAELEGDVMNIRDPSTLPFLQKFAVTGHDSRLRSAALQALRRIGSPHSAAAYLKELNDEDTDNGFSAMQGLLSLGAPHEYMEWVPNWKQFDENPQFYAAKCREWWSQTQNQAKSASQN